MTLVWIILWCLFACAIFGVLGWSINILMAQKNAWKEFAAKYKLSLEGGRKFLEPYSISGTLHGRELRIFSEAEQTDRERTQRIYTYVEVSVVAPPNVAFILSKKKLPDPMAQFGLSLPAQFSMPSPDWPQLAVSQTSDAYALANWLNPARIRTLKAFMDSADRITETLFLSSGDYATLVWRTEDPLRDPRNLNALVQKLFGWARDFDGIDTGMTAKPNAPKDTVPPENPA